MRVKCSQRWSRAARCSSAADSRLCVALIERLLSRAALGRSGACVDKRLLQDLEAFIQLGVRYYERREDPNDVAVEAAGKEEKPSLAGRGDGGLRKLAGRLLRRR